MTLKSPRDTITDIQVEIEMVFADLADRSKPASIDRLVGVLARIHGNCTNLGIVLVNWQPKPEPLPEPTPQPKKAKVHKAPVKKAAAKPKRKGTGLDAPAVKASLAIQCPLCDSKPGELCVVLTTDGKRTDRVLRHSGGIHPLRRVAAGVTSTKNEPVPARLKGRLFDDSVAQRINDTLDEVDASLKATRAPEPSEEPVMAATRWELP